MQNFKLIIAIVAMALFTKELSAGENYQLL